MSGAVVTKGYPTQPKRKKRKKRGRVVMPASPRYAKIEKLGAKAEGTDVFINIDGKEVFMPWPVAQLFIQQMGAVIEEAKQNDPRYHQLRQNIAEEHRKHG